MAEDWTEEEMGRGILTGDEEHNRLEGKKGRSMYEQKEKKKNYKNKKKKRRKMTRQRRGKEEKIEEEKEKWQPTPAKARVSA
ncbi:hypothetical protein C1H46_018485 [Malus baccata]|uniref:Uncharacterized protein n=1 Tax=Malus baccata TaxID=106549 RepID=A0A540MAY7_MALBA|nr:hypothetical protein C1H46_018485 [Malus baccata]